MPRRSEQEKRELVSRWEASGLGKAAFGRLHGVSPNSLTRWREALRVRAFVEVEVATPVASEFVVQVPSGVEVRVPNGFDAEELRRLVTALC